MGECAHMANWRGCRYLRSYDHLTHAWVWAPEWAVLHGVVRQLQPLIPYVLLGAATRGFVDECACLMIIPSNDMLIAYVLYVDANKSDTLNVGLE